MVSLNSFVTPTFFSCEPVKNVDQEPCLDTILKQQGLKFKEYSKLTTQFPNAVPDFQIFIKIKYLMPIQ